MLEKEIELLAPAGDIEKLRSALHFGADAVYLAGESMGLRTGSKNFSIKDLKEAVDLIHGAGKKMHVTLNIIAHNDDFQGLDDYIEFLDKLGVDAVIVADPGIFMQVKKHSKMDIHISTQANVTNSATVNFWHQMGAKRVVLARELSLEEIRQIRKDIDPSMELEVFAHGAMCISYSGRCLLSNYMTGRDANRGDCAQACRWKYKLIEEKRPDQSFEIGEDGRGTFIMNSKDLCLLPYLPDLIEAGVNSFKLEGRVKSQFYVSTVVNAYRKALDAIKASNFNESLINDLMEELNKCSHRSYTNGFLSGKAGPGSQNYGSSSYEQGAVFLGLIKEGKDKRAYVELRNRFEEGDKVEILRAGLDKLSFKIEDLRDEAGEKKDLVNRPNSLVSFKLDEEIKAGDILRKNIR